MSETISCLAKVTSVQWRRAAGSESHCDRLERGWHTSKESIDLTEWLETGSKWLKEGTGRVGHETQQNKENVKSISIRRKGLALKIN